MSIAGPPTRSLSVVAALASVALATPATGQVEAVPREPAAEQTVRWGPLFLHYQLEPGPPDRVRLAARVSNGGPRFLPGHRLPWLPPRAAADVTLTYLSVVSPGRSRRRFVRTLGLPDLPWGSSGAMVPKRFLREGFREAGSAPNGSLLFNGHDFLGRNAGLIARVHEGRLVKIAALMEPNDGSDVRSEYRALRKRLIRIYGPPASDRNAPARLSALWQRMGPDGLHRAQLRTTDDGLLRLDMEPPEWRRLHGDVVRTADAGGRGRRKDLP